MASAVTSPQPNPFTEEQISFLVYHFALRLKPEHVYDIFNAQFSTKHEHSVLRHTTSLGRRNLPHYLTVAEEYEWFEPELRVFTPEDEDEVEKGQPVRQKQRVVDLGIEEEHRAFMATQYAYTANTSDIFESLETQFKIRFNERVVKRYLNCILKQNKEELERLLSVASKYSWYKPPNARYGSRAARLQKQRQLSKTFQEDNRPKRDAWRKEERDDPEEIVRTFQERVIATREAMNTLNASSANTTSEDISSATVVQDESQVVEKYQVLINQAPHNIQARNDGQASKNSQVRKNSQVPYNIEAVSQNQAPYINNQTPSSTDYRLGPVLHLPEFVMAPPTRKSGQMSDVEVTSSSHKNHERKDSDGSMELSPVPLPAKPHRRKPPPPSLDLISPHKRHERHDSDISMGASPEKQAPHPSIQQTPNFLNDKGERMKLEEKLKLIAEKNANDKARRGLDYSTNPADYLDATGRDPFILRPRANAPPFGSHQMPDGTITYVPHIGAIGPYRSLRNPSTLPRNPYTPRIPDVEAIEPGPYRLRQNYHAPLASPFHTGFPPSKPSSHVSSLYSYPGSRAETATPSTTPTPTNSVFINMYGSRTPTQVIFANNPYEFKPKKTTITTTTTTAPPPLPVASTSTTTATSATAQPREFERERERERERDRNKLLYGYTEGYDRTLMEETIRKTNARIAASEERYREENRRALRAMREMRHKVKEEEGEGGGSK